MKKMTSTGANGAQGRVFELAAELFAVLATPMRLRVLSALCEREKSVNELLAEIDTTQPNLSQHLAVLDRKSTRLNSSHIQKSRMPSSA